jgi:hypothetical protein
VLKLCDPRELRLQLSLQFVDRRVVNFVQSGAVV